MSNDLESLTSNGNAFQSFGAAQVNDPSPGVALDINAGCLKGGSIQFFRVNTSHKLRRHEQSFGKIATIVVLDKDENLSWSGLQRHRSCHSNEMTLLPFLLAAVYLGAGNCNSKIVHGSFFLQWPPRCSWSLKEICKGVIDIVWGEVYMVRNTVKKLTTLFFAVMCRKWSAFDMQLHLRVVLKRLKLLWGEIACQKHFVFYS